MAIYANLMGRLGNQMFIYAFARAVMAQSGDKQLFLTSGEEIRLHNYNIIDCQTPTDNKIHGNLLQFALSTFYGKSAVGKTQRQLADFEEKYHRLFEKFGLFYRRNGYLPFRVKKQNNIYIYIYQRLFSM